MQNEGFEQKTFPDNRGKPEKGSRLRLPCLSGLRQPDATEEGKAPEKSEPPVLGLLGYPDCKTTMPFIKVRFSGLNEDVTTVDDDATIYRFFNGG